MSNFTWNTINSVGSHIWDGNSTFNNSGTFNSNFTNNSWASDFIDELSKKFDEILLELRNNKDIDIRTLNTLANKKQEFMEIVNNAPSDKLNISWIEKMSEIATIFSKATENISSAVDTWKKLAWIFTSMMPVLIPWIKTLLWVIWI